MDIAVDFDYTLFAADKHGNTNRFPIDQRAASVMQQWVDDGHKVSILTWRHQMWTDECRTLMMLNEFPRVPVISAYEQNKQDYDWDILIDDDDELHSEWMAGLRGARDDRTLILFSQHYNEYLKSPTRADTWDEVADIVDYVIANGHTYHNEDY